VVDATDPTNLKFLTMDSVTELAGIAASGSNLYAATASGLSVYQITGWKLAGRPDAGSGRSEPP